MSLDIKADISIRDQWARQHAIRGVQVEWNKLVRHHAPDGDQDRLLLDGDELPSAPTPPPPSSPIMRDPRDRPKIVRLGIVGAGAAGLFAAMVLDYLNFELFKRAALQGKGTGVMPSTGDHSSSRSGSSKEQPELIFKYDILESASPERLGGRLFTYNFGGDRDSHDYYDVGAMRFPDNPVMRRTFDLFTRLGMKKDDLKTNPDAEDGSIIPYYMKNADTKSSSSEPWRYNDITLWGTYKSLVAQAADNDPFQMATDGSIPRTILQYSPDEVMNAAIEPFRKALKQDALKTPPGRTGWDLLMKYDTFSTRQDPPEPLPEGPIPPPPYNYDTIEWMETFNGGTNWYDQAHSETVLESLDFGFSDDTKWYCILGGAQQLAKKMEAKLSQKPVYNSTVTAIRATGTMQVDVDVVTPSVKETKKYNGVFNTTTLGCLRRMDLTNAGLTYSTKQAARSLGYGSAAKVAIKFKRAWWIHDLKGYNIKMGGLGHSDLNTRTCVYPSYNIYDDKTKTAVLLNSYTWQQDSERLASLMSTNPDHAQKVKDEAVLKELLFRELVHLHKNNDMTDDELYSLISDNYIDHHAFDWYKEPNAAGAFAFFRPQQFSSMWNKMIQPSGDVVIVGEASSPHHAWVVGALESVVHGIHAWMGLNLGLVPEFAVAMEILEHAKAGIPFVGLPPYMDANISKWHSLLGMIYRQKHLGEMEERQFASYFTQLRL
ncbi:hypothetical protein BDZ45DRAFT_587255 [Acephala macrosclerotiorum]|nr:hypothetical protein BDZ45DRAFT_587255 [Acephala macrosclerotiorum]